jgi:hypothetical protein
MHIVEAALSFTSLPARNPDQKSTPQLLVGIQQRLSLGLQYFLALLRRDPDLALSLEELYLLERQLAEHHIQREAVVGGQAVSTLGLLVATITHLIELARLQGLRMRERILKGDSPVLESGELPILLRLACRPHWHASQREVRP